VGDADVVVGGGGVVAVVVRGDVVGRPLGDDIGPEESTVPPSVKYKSIRLCTPEATELIKASSSVVVGHASRVT
jgi:hypothetical protein